MIISRAGLHISDKSCR